MEIMMKNGEFKNKKNDQIFLSITFKDLFHIFFDCFQREKIIMMGA